MRRRRVESLAIREWGDLAHPGVYDRLVEIGCAVVDRCQCRAIVGHSLGAYIAVGVAAVPSAGLQAAVLIDGGFMEAADMVAVGVPVTAERAQLVEWLTANRLQFPSWEDASRELAAMMNCDQTPAFAAYVSEVFAEVDGHVRELTAPEDAANLLLATFDHDARPLAGRLAAPTLLIACGQPAERRAVRARAWSAFAAGSPLVELHVADDWGHNPIFQDPDSFSTVIAGWLRGHVAVSGTSHP